eukprot:10752301-Karenia_brevis.AAC.1
MHRANLLQQTQLSPVLAKAGRLAASTAPTEHSDSRAAQRSKSTKRSRPCWSQIGLLRAHLQ